MIGNKESREKTEEDPTVSFPLNVYTRRCLIRTLVHYKVETG